MTLEQALYEDLVKELTRREVPFIRRETLTWLRQLIKEAGEADPVWNFTQDDLPLVADLWEYAFLTPPIEERNV